MTDAKLVFYSTLRDSLPDSVACVLVRIILSYCDVALYTTAADNVRQSQQQLLPALSGRYTALPSPHYARFDFEQKLCVGMRLDVKSRHGVWNTAAIVSVGKLAEQSWLSLCDTCVEEWPKCHDQQHSCILVQYDELNDLGEKGQEWISTLTHCLKCKLVLPLTRRPFLSVWSDPQERQSLNWSAYFGPGIRYSRPYLDKYTVQIEDSLSPSSSFGHCRISIRGMTSQSVIRRHILRYADIHCRRLNCVVGARYIAAMTCDDNGRIYALTKPCPLLLIITLLRLGQTSSNSHSSDPHSQFATTCYWLGDDWMCYGSWQKGQFIMCVDDASMVLCIQELNPLATQIVRTMAFALPLLPASLPKL